MRIKKALREDQDLIDRFLAVLGSGLTIASVSRVAKPGFFLYATEFIHGYLEPVYLKKEDALLETLEYCGFPSDQGPVGNMRNGHRKSRDLSRMLTEAARLWQSGDEAGRSDAIWATSEYTSLMRRNFELLKNLIYPLLEQSTTPEDEQKLAARINLLSFQEAETDGSEKYLKMIEALEEEVSDWR